MSVHSVPHLDRTYRRWSNGEAAPHRWGHLIAPELAETFPKRGLQKRKPISKT